jgi:peptidoglycan DL-endopeptidase CwlO
MTSMERWTSLAVLAVLLPGTWACATAGGTPRPFPPASPPSDTEPAAEDRGAVARAPRAADMQRIALISTALDLRGTRYRFGGTDTSGFDCSGFTQYVFAKHDLQLPREARDQFRTGTPVRRQDLRPGDLIFFTTTAPGPSHVGIALGGDEFVHAPSSRGVVRIDRISSAYWSRRLIGARRMD